MIIRVPFFLSTVKTRHPSRWQFFIVQSSRKNVIDRTPRYLWNLSEIGCVQSARSFNFALWITTVYSSVVAVAGKNLLNIRSMPNLFCNCSNIDYVHFLTPSHVLLQKSTNLEEHNWRYDTWARNCRLCPLESFLCQAERVLKYPRINKYWSFVNMP